MTALEGYQLLIGTILSEHDQKIYEKVLGKAILGAERAYGLLIYGEKGSGKTTLLALGLSIVGKKPDFHIIFDDGTVGRMLVIGDVNNNKEILYVINTTGEKLENDTFIECVHAIVGGKDEIREMIKRKMEEKQDD